MVSLLLSGVSLNHLVLEREIRVVLAKPPINEPSNLVTPLHFEKKGFAALVTSCQHSAGRPIPVERATYPLLPHSLGHTRPTLDAHRCLVASRLVGGDIELGTTSVGLELEGVELLADAGQGLAALEALVGFRLELLGSFALLLLGLLRTNDALVAERGLQPLQL